MTGTRRTAAWLACLACLGLALLGCNRAAAPKSPGPAAPAAAPAAVEETGPFAAGKKVFAATNCGRCHTVGDAGGPPGGATAGEPSGPGGPGRGKRNRGPDLAEVGRDPEHTPEWLAEHVRDAKSHKPDSRMPPFEGKIPEDDLRALIEYLASLK